MLLAAIAIAPGPGRGLTIYRIGGVDKPLPPETGVEGVELEIKSWEEMAEAFDGQTSGLAMGPEGIGPILAGPDLNLVLGAAESGFGPAFYAQWRGVNVWGALEGNEAVARIADGDSTTAFGLRLSGTAGLERFPPTWPGDFVIDLGWSFPVNRIRFYPRPGYAGQNVENFDVGIIESNVAPGRGKSNYRGILRDLYPEDTLRGTPLGHWKLIPVGSVRANRQPSVDFSFPTRYAEYVALRVTSHEVWEVAELEIYGDGYVSEALYQSGVLDLGAASVLGSVSWSGFTDPKANISIHTRSGSDSDPNRYWRFTGRGQEMTFLDEGGQPLTRAAYDNLSAGRGGITQDLDHWSAWSGSYDFADSLGVPVSSPGPRRFLQLQVGFTTRGMDAGGLGQAEFRVSHPPVTDAVVGEVWPAEADPAEVTAFVYALRPDVGLEASGLDRLVLATSGRFVGVDSVRVNEVRQDLNLVEPLQDRRLALSLPRLGPEDSRKLVEVFFRAQVFHFGTPFEGTVFDSERPLEVGQRVEPGNATFRLDSNQLRVGIRLGADLLRETKAGPPVITPNGDGVNDQAQIEYTVLRLASAGAVVVDIYDLAGRPVRRVYEGRDPSGRHVRAWYGRGEDGHVVAPGIYLYQIRVEADDRREERSGLIAVVY